MITQQVSSLGFKNVVEPMTNQRDFSGKDEVMQTGQQSITGRKKSIVFKFLGVRDEDLENLLYFANNAHEEEIRKRQESVNSGGSFSQLPWVKKSVDLMNLNMIDVNGSLTLFDYSKKAHEKAIRKQKQCSTHSHCSVPPFR